MSMQQQLAVYGSFNSQATNDVKIPDGKVALSSGYRHQISTQIEDNNTSRITMIIYPGLTAGIATLHSVTEGPGDNGGVGNLLSGVTTHIRYTNGADLTPDGMYKTQGDAYSKWRVVSQGMKISLVNSEDTNDGWWEAVRVHVSKKQFPSGPAGIRVTPDGIAPDNLATNGGETPVAQVFPFMLGESMADNPTYVSGSLKSIHKETFTLAPASNEHTFLDQDPSLDNGGAGTDRPQNFANAFDDSFDCIVLRIFGNPATAGANAVTRLHCHMIANHEYVYDWGSKLHNTMTRTYDALSSVHMVNRRLKGLLRSATAKTSATTAYSGISKRRTKKRGATRIMRNRVTRRKRISRVTRR